MRKFTLAALAVATVAGLAFGAAAGSKAQAQMIERAKAQATVESRTAYADCGAVTVIVIGANSYGAGQTFDTALRACGNVPAEVGDGPSPYYTVRAR